MADDLLPSNVSEDMDSKISTDNTTDSSLFAKVYTGSDQTAQTPSKKGDRFIKEDGTIYIAKTTNPATGWVQVSPSE